ncbi:MAG: DUF47 family protein [Propionibacterium sp.]|nr:DUF47 family protein [Propionibacterium sp.]
MKVPLGGCRAWRSTRRKRSSRILVRQIDCALEAARLANQVCSLESDCSQARRSMRTIEHAGDDARRSLVREIEMALNVPLEREDLFRASRSIDDVLDSTRDLVREIAEWEVPLGDWSRGAMDPVESALARFREALRSEDPERARSQYLAARQEARRTRRVYDRGLAIVLRQEVTADILKQREVLRRIESIGRDLIEVSNALLDGMVKRYL